MAPHPNESFTITGDSLVGDADVAGTSGEVRAWNPRTGESHGPAFGLGDAAPADRAASLAWNAFPVFRRTGDEERAAFLDQVAANLEAVSEDLVGLVRSETGIAEARGRGELARTVNQLRLFGEVLREGGWHGVRIETALPERAPLPRPDLRQRRVPLGPVAVFGASNFPLAFSVAGGDTASALAAGCPVVVKAHSAHPGTSELVGRAVRAAVREQGLPEGTFSLLHGTGRELGTALVSHPAIRAVGFTGSRTGGLALAAAAAARPVPIPVYAEMSSVNPVLVLPGALSRRGAELGGEFASSLTTGTGQLCTKPGLVFLIGDEGADRFVRAAAEAVSRCAAAPMLNSDTHAAFEAGVERLRSLEGVREVAAGLADDSIAAACRARLFETDGDTFLADPRTQAEVFGASSLIVRLRGTAQAREVLALLEGQLTATLQITEDDHDRARELLPDLELLAGRIVVNGWPTGVDVGHAMVHGGPFPSTSDGRSTSVGSLSIERFLRPVAYQNVPDDLLPPPVRDGNPLRAPRQIDGRQEATER